MKKINLNPQTKTKLMYEEKMKIEPLTEEEIKHYRFVLFTYNRLEKQWRTIKAIFTFIATFGIVELIKNYNFLLSLFTFIGSFIYITYKNYQIKHKLSKPRKNEWYQYVVLLSISNSVVLPYVINRNEVISKLYFVTQFVYSFYYANKAYQYGKEDNEK